MALFAGLNYPAMLAAALAAFALGAFWYSPVGFGTAWLKALNKKPDELGPAGPAMVISLAGCVVAVVVLAVLFEVMGVATWWGGGLWGLGIGVGLVSTAMASDHAFCGNSLPLFAIQAGYRVAYLTVMGLILGAWQ